VAVRPVKGRDDLDRFIAFPYELHKRDPFWVPLLRVDVRNLLDRSKNAFFDHAEAEYFLAEREGQVVGRIAAITNRLHNEFHHDKVGFFGFFESIYDHAVADPLFDTAADWLRSRGHDVMRGPASFSTNDECGLLVAGYDTPPCIMMPHNPPYYERLFDAARFQKAKDLIAMRGGWQAQYLPVPERTVRGTELMKKRLGVTMRPLNMANFKAEVELVKSLYNRCWERNWGFVPMTDREIDQLAVQFKPVVNPDLVPFLMKDGEAIGFALALPDLNVVFRRHRSGRLTPALILDLLTSLKFKRIRKARILLLGVVPEWRGRGLDAVLYHWIWSKAAEHGMYWGEGGWVLEDNHAIRQGLGKMGFTDYRTYRLYDRPL